MEDSMSGLTLFGYCCGLLLLAIFAWLFFLEKRDNERSLSKLQAEVQRLDLWQREHTTPRTTLAEVPESSDDIFQLQSGQTVLVSFTDDPYVKEGTTWFEAVFDRCSTLPNGATGIWLKMGESPAECFSMAKVYLDHMPPTSPKEEPNEPS